MTSVLFVCLGNICRSPAAEGVLRYMVSKDPELKNIHIRSCGMGTWFLGNLPDERIRYAAKARGVELTSRSQVFDLKFFDEFDYIFAADQEVLAHLLQLAKKSEHKAKIQMFTAYSKLYLNEEIPDPFHQGEAAFDRVLDIIEDACEGFISHLKTQNAG